MSSLATRPGVLLLVFGLLLVPGPLYATTLDSLDGPERHRVPQGYQATSIDAANDTLLADRYSDSLTFEVSDFEYRHVRTDYRAPNRTRSVLERALATGSATTTDATVASDLRSLDRKHSFLTRDWDRYWTFSVSTTSQNDTTNASTTTVTTDVATVSERAAAVRRSLTVDYTALSPAERETFEKIRDATTTDDDYRPWSDEPVPENPLVVKNGTYYAVSHVTSTDDFSFPPGFFLGIVGSVLGIVCLVVGGLVELVGWYRRATD